MEPGRWCLERRRGIRRAERRSWGMKARRSGWSGGGVVVDVGACDDACVACGACRWRRVLYGLKLCRWSRRVRWYVHEWVM